MKVKELKELLKDQPDDLEVIFGRLDEDYENYYTEVKNVNVVKMYKTQPVNSDRPCYYNETKPYTPHFEFVETKMRALLLYNKENVCFENLQPNIIN